MMNHNISDNAQILRQVEGVYYKVHAYLFTRYSSYWATELATSALFDEPIVLKDVLQPEFDALLSMLYSVYAFSVFSTAKAEITG